MPLPAGIPETVKCSQIQVAYTISAILTYKKTASSTNTTTEKIENPVILVRLPENDILNGENYSTTSTIDSQFQPFLNWCKYRITIDKKSVALGSRLPVKIEIVPCLIGLRVKQVFLQLIERRTMTSNEDRIEKTNQLCHFIHPAKNACLVLPSRALTTHWHAQCDYQVPFQNNKLAHSTRDYDHFRIHHVLLVSLLVSLPCQGDDHRSGTTQGAAGSRYSTKTISFQTPIDLLDSQLTQFEQPYLQDAHTMSSDGLPSYDCPISMEEVEKLNRHGLYYNQVTGEYPPSYGSLIATS